jgi:hypothetical protein
LVGITLPFFVRCIEQRLQTDGMLMTLETFGQPSAQLQTKIGTEVDAL